MFIVFFYIQKIRVVCKVRYCRILVSESISAFQFVFLLQMRNRYRTLAIISANRSLSIAMSKSDSLLSSYYCLKFCIQDVRFLPLLLLPFIIKCRILCSSGFRITCRKFSCLYVLIQVCYYALALFYFNSHRRMNSIKKSNIFISFQLL